MGGFSILGGGVGPVRDVRELRNAIERAISLEESSEDNERQLLSHALEKTNGNQTQAARLPRITRDTPRYEMKTQPVLGCIHAQEAI